MNDHIISQLCYELYKTEWKQHHIDEETENNTIRNYLNFLIEENVDGKLYTYSDYLDEFGYNGELYVCYEEFLEAEYLEEDYICGLLNSEKLIDMYYKDVLRGNA